MVLRSLGETLCKEPCLFVGALLGTNQVCEGSMRAIFGVYKLLVVG